MKHRKITIWWMVAGFALSLPLFGMAEDKLVKGSPFLTQAQKPQAHTLKIPVYKPKP